MPLSKDRFPMRHVFTSSFALFVVMAAASAATGAAQPPSQAAPLPDGAAVRKIGDTVYEIGAVRVDTATREVVVPASVNAVQVLEFVANSPTGVKAYESALTLEVDAVRLNAALLLVGLDPSRGRAPKMVFDPNPATGDPVEMFLSWGTRRVNIDELLYDQKTGKTVPAGTWVYTGSTFVDTGDGRRRYAAELDGILIGLMHSPSAIIERAEALTDYGSTVMNPNLGLPAGARVTLTIRAVSGPGTPR